MFDCHISGELLVEEVGQVVLPEGAAGTPTALTSQGSLLCLLQGVYSSNCSPFSKLLSGEQHVWVSEIRLRPDTEVLKNFQFQPCQHNDDHKVSPSRSSLLALPGREERRYLDCCILSHAPSARYHYHGCHQHPHYRHQFTTIIINSITITFITFTTHAPSARYYQFHH